GSSVPAFTLSRVLRHRGIQHSLLVRWSGQAPGQDGFNQGVQGSDHVRKQQSQNRRHAALPQDRSVPAELRDGGEIASDRARGRYLAGYSNGMCRTRRRFSVMPVVTSPERTRRGSKRLRRLAWTASALLVLLAISAIVTWRIRKENQPDEYVPGEASNDITNVAADRGSNKAAMAAPPKGKIASQRAVDRLLDPGKKLPAGAPAPFFTDVTKEASLAGFRQFAGARTSQLPEDMGSGVAWSDFDNDGLEDVFVVSAGGSLNAPESQLAPSVLYRNSGNGSFEKVKGFPDLRIHGMAAAWGDFDNDGRLDLVVTSYDRIYLFHNNSDGTFTDVSHRAGLDRYRGFWAGAVWGDYDRDGYLDLYVCGYVKYTYDAGKNGTTSEQFGMDVPYSLNPASFEPERNLLFHNIGHGAFTEVGKELGVSNPDGRSLVALWHDFNGDSWPDLYVANDISENKLYINHHGKFVDAGKDAWVEEYRGSMGLAAGDFD